MHTCKRSQLCPTLQLHGLQPAKLLCPWNFPGKNTRGLLFLPPGDFPDPGIEPTSLASPALVGRFFTTLSPNKYPNKFSSHREENQGVEEPMVHIDTQHKIILLQRDSTKKSFCLRDQCFQVCITLVSNF